MVYQMVMSARKKVFTCCHFLVSHQEKNLAVYPLRLCTSTARNTGSVSDWGNKIPHALWCSQKVRRERENFETPISNSSPSIIGLNSSEAVQGSMNTGL